MALQPLVTIEELTDRLGSAVCEDNLTRAKALINDASALVRRYTRQDFDAVSDDKVVLRPVGTFLRLPQRPVTAVTTVAAVGSNGVPDLALAGWTWDGLDLVNVAGISSGVFVSLPEWWDNIDAGALSYRVTYGHGYAATPPDVVAVVSAMVNRVLMSPSPVEGLVGETIGQYSYQLQQSGGSPGLAVRLTDADKELLAAFRIASTSIQTPAR